MVSFVFRSCMMPWLRKGVSLAFREGWVLLGVMSRGCALVVGAFDLAAGGASRGRRRRRERKRWYCGYGVRDGGAG